MIQKTYNLIDFILRHFHYCIWTLCLLLLVFDKIIHLPLDFLYNLNFIPEYFMNMSKIINIQPSTDVIVPETHNNQDTLINLNEEFKLLEQEIKNINESLSTITSQIKETNIITREQINTQIETARVLSNTITKIPKTDFSDLTSIIQENNSIAKGQTEINLKIVKRLFSNLNEYSNTLSTINESIINMKDSLIEKSSINDVQNTLNIIISNQENLLESYNSLLDLNIQGFNSIHISQDSFFVDSQNSLNNTFNKINELRNHNIDIARQLDYNISNKVEGVGSDTVKQITEEINRPKSSSTGVNTNKSWSSFFDRKN